MNLALFFAILSLASGVASVLVLVITCINVKRIRQTRTEINSRRTQRKR